MELGKRQWRARETYRPIWPYTFLPDLRAGPLGVVDTQYDFTARFPRIAEAVKGLPVLSCLIDGEATIAVD